MRWFVAIIPALIAALAACQTETTREVARGVAVEGLCYTTREPAVVESDHSDVSFLEDYELSGAAHQDRIELAWDPQVIPGLVGYRVARYSYDEPWHLDGNSIRTFEVNDGSTEFTDTDGLKPDREYRYRVFPVTTDGIGTPSRRLVIWTMPADLPPPPNKVTVDKNRYLRIEFSILAPVTGIRVLRRDNASGIWQHLADEEYPRKRRFRSSWSWGPEEGDLGKENDYAVCLANGYGYGKALLLEAATTETIDPPPTPTSVRNIFANSTRDGVELRWSQQTDPSVVGILVHEAIWEYDITIWRREVLLPADATSHVAPSRKSKTSRGYYYRNVYGIQTINGYGVTDEYDTFGVLADFTNLQVGKRETYAWDPWSTKEQRPTLLVGMRSDSPVKFEVVRKELTEEGFREKPIPIACAWQYRGLDRYCEIEDLDVVRGRWYIYEIRWQLEDGSWKTDFHEVLILDPR